LEQLDEYEGINEPADDSDISFRRDLVEVIIPKGNTTAWIYWFNSPVQDKPVIASGDVLEYLHQQQQKQSDGH